MAKPSGSRCFVVTVNQIARFGPIILSGAKSLDYSRASAHEDVPMQAITRFWSDESGATAMEYGLLVALISVVIIGAVKAVGGNLSTKFNVVAGNLT